MVHNVQWLTRLTITDASPPAVLLIRLYVGWYSLPREP